MTAKDVTLALLISIGLILFVYDVVVSLVWGHQASISVVLAETGQRWPIVPLLLGGLLFHVYWPLWRR
jgi:hypothetical protein